MAYLQIIDNKLIGIYANQQAEMNLVFVENEPEPSPSNFHSFSIENGWFLTAEDIEKQQQLAVERNKAEKSRLFNDAVAMIKMYEEAEADNDILPEELDLLKNWRTYQRKINRIADLTQEVIGWPALPE